MLDDITLLDENEASTEDIAAAPPLCLVHYFGATGQGPPTPLKGRIAERHGNLIILEFALPPKSILGKPPKRLLRKAGDMLFLLLLLVSVIGCLAAFRF